MTLLATNILRPALGLALIVAATFAPISPTTAAAAVSEEPPVRKTLTSGTIRLRSTSTYDPNTSVITLGDVADLTGSYATALSGLIIRNEMHRTSVTVTLADIRTALKSPTYIEHAPGPEAVNHALLTVSGGKCTVRAARPAAESDETSDKTSTDSAASDEQTQAQQLDRPTFWLSEFTELPGTVGAAVTRTLALRLEAEMQPRDVQYTCDTDDYTFLTLPIDARGIEVIPLATAMSPRVPIEINLYEGRTITESRRMTVDITALVDVLVLQSYVSRNAELMPNDLAVETRLVPPATIPAYPIDLPYAGRQARSRLSKGQVLYVNDLMDPVLVQARSQVIVRAHAGNWVVRMPAIALEDGRPGQIIRIKRLNDRTELLARIEPDGELVIPSSLGGDLP